MLSFTPLLGISLSGLGTGSRSLITPSRLQSTSVSRFPLVPLIQIEPLAFQAPLIRTSKLLSVNTDRSEIGWDNWSPLDSSLDTDSLELNPERDAGSVQELDDRSERLDDSIDDPNLNFFTTILAPPPEIDRSPEQVFDRQQDDRLSINPDAEAITLPAKKERAKSAKKSKSKLATQISPDSVELDLNKYKQVTPEPTTITDRKTAKSSIQKVAENRSLVNGTSELSSDELPQFNSSILPSITSPSLEIETTLAPSNLLEVDTRSSKLYPDILQIEPLALTNVDAPILSSTVLPSILEATPSSQLAENTESSKLNRDILQVDPLALTNIDSQIPSSTALPSVLEATPSNQLAESTKSENELSLNNPSSDSRSIQPNIQPSILPRSVQPKETFISSDGIGVDAESREVSLADFQIDRRSISTSINDPILSSTALTSSQLQQETPARFDRSEVDAIPESEVNLSELPFTPISIPTNLEPSPLAPTLPSSSQLEPPVIDGFTVNNKFTSEVSHGDSLLVPADNNLPTITSSSSLLPQLDLSLTASNQIDTNTESIDIDPDNLSLDRLSSLINNQRSNFPVNLTTLPPLEETTIHLQQSEIDPESASEANSDNSQIDPLSISTEISPEVIPPNLFISLQPEETSIPARQIHLAPSYEAEVNLDNLQIDPLSISANINPTIIPGNISPSSQLDVVPTRANQLEVNTKASDPSLSNLQSDSLLSSPDIASILPLSLQQDESSIPTKERVVDIEGTSELSLNNLLVDISATTIINNSSPIEPTADPSLDVENTSVEITKDSDSQCDTTNETNSNLQATDDSFTQSKELLLSPVNSEDNLKPSIPVKGYATGGYVKESDRVDLESIAASDTVAAMLTPGEFVINAKDAQKNLNLLTHINSGGEPDTSLGSQAQPISTSIQAKSQVYLHQISFLNPSPLDNFVNSPTENNRSSTNYSSPDLIFRKPQSDRQTSEHTIFRTPDEWGNIEELINGNNYTDRFDFSGSSQDSLPPQHNNNFTIDPMASSSPAIAPKMSPVRGFADGGEVNLPDISREIEPISQTIAAPTSTNEESIDSAELEILAREIYHRLRQRLEIERERHGSYSGNLSW